MDFQKKNYKANLSCFKGCKLCCVLIKLVLFFVSIRVPLLPATNLCQVTIIKSIFKKRAPHQFSLFLLLLLRFADVLLTI